MDPYNAERRGIKYNDFRKFQDLADEDGYLYPYTAEAHGIPYSAWSEWQREYERRRV